MHICWEKHQAFGTGTPESTVTEPGFSACIKVLGFRSTLETQETTISEGEVGAEDSFSLWISNQIFADAQGMGESV